MTVEEWLPLRAGERVGLAWEEGGAVMAGSADRWTELVKLAGAKPIVRYSDGPAAGGPAVTRYELGDGQAWYVSACTDAATTAALLAGACESAGLVYAVRPADGGDWPRDLEVVRRTDGDRRFITLINHGENKADVTIGDRLVTVQAGDVTVTRTESPRTVR